MVRIVHQWYEASTVRKVWFPSRPRHEIFAKPLMPKKSRLSREKVAAKPLRKSWLDEKKLLADKVMVSVS